MKKTRSYSVLQFCSAAVKQGINPNTKY